MNTESLCFPFEVSYDDSIL